ncbi:hypothetical protein [Streptomyces anthocyanicus]|uniref:hypothetical protein n=1 Tax=Streptomyces anthocyanicus TaxID=68174 RepID=UPI003868C29D|nr:hypothetical protein OH747_23020 [Streptomyces anthocyanicus]
MRNMIEPSVPADGAEALLDEPTSPSEYAPADLSGFQQADVLKADRIPLRGPSGEVIWHATPDGVVIISQTCDVVQPNKTYLQVAPIVRLPQGLVKQAVKGAMPGYVAVPEAGYDAFADLDHIATVSKAHVALLVPQRGVAGVAALRVFGMRVGRRFSRFAFPDEVVPWLEPLKRSVISKAGKTSSPLGRVLDEWVESLRLECTPSWDAGPPYQLTLLVIVKPGLLPAVDENEVPDPPAQLTQWLWDEKGNVKQRPASIADRLVKADASGDRSERLWLWEGFGQSLVADCKPHPSASDEILDAVADGEIDVEVSTIRDITYERVLRSEEIDVEHLSPPLPR